MRRGEWLKGGQQQGKKEREMAREPVESGAVTNKVWPWNGETKPCVHPVFCKEGFIGTHMCPPVQCLLCVGRGEGAAEVTSGCRQRPTKPGKSVPLQQCWLGDTRQCLDTLPGVTAGFGAAAGI